MLFLAGAQILCGYVYDAVRVDIEGNLDLRNAAACRRDPIQSELAEGLVVLRELSLTLQHVDVNGRLVIRRRGEDLALLGRDRGVSLDQSGRDAAHGLNGQGQRSNIQKQDVACARVSGQLAALDGSADGNALIRVQALAGLMSGQHLHLILYGRDTGGAAHQQNLAQLGSGDSRISQSVLYRNRGLFHQVMGQLVELRSGQIHIKMLRAFRRRGDKGQVDVGGGGAGQLLLRLLRRFLQSLHGHLVAGQVDALLLLKLAHHPVDHLVVKVIAAQMGIAVGSQNFDHAVADLDDGHIEGTAAQVVYHDLLLFFIIKAVSQSSGCRLVDDTLYIQARDLARVLGGLTLGVVEVCGNGDDGLRHLFADVVFRVRLQLLQDHCGDLLRRILLSVNVHLIVASHMSLNGRNGPLRVRHRLTLCGLADQPLAGLRKRDHAGRGARAFRVCDNSGLAALHHCHAAVCRTKVNTDNLAHNKLLRSALRRLFCSMGFPDS